MSLNNDMRKAVRAAQANGWVLQDTSRGHHYKLRHPSGMVVVASVSPSDHHAVKNFQGDIARVERKSGQTIAPREGDAT